MTDRIIPQPGAAVLDTDILNIQRWAMSAIGNLAAAVIGTGTYVDGFALANTGSPSMSLVVGPGVIFSNKQVDSTAFGSLSIDSSPLVKLGINETSTALSFVAPASPGNSVNNLIQVTFQETDDTPVVLPYYDSANPSIVFWGPNGSGAATNTRRAQRAILSVVAGTPAATGSQTTPAASAGCTALYVVTTAYGQTSLTNDNILHGRVGPWLDNKLSRSKTMSFFLGMN